MNIYRLLGDSSHSIAILFLLSWLISQKSAHYISGKTQILYLMVFVTRYLDLFTNYISMYNSLMKMFFILSKCTVVYLIFFNNDIKKTYAKNFDTLRIEILLIPCALLALLFNHEFSAMEVLWTFSIYLEAVVILPQLWMVRKMGVIVPYMLIYLTTLGMYRAFYGLNWIYRYNEENFYDIIAIVAGCVQTSIYVLAAINAITCKCVKYTGNVCENDKAFFSEVDDAFKAKSLTGVVGKLPVTLNPGGTGLGEHKVKGDVIIA